MVSPMRRVNEVMSQDMGNYLTNFKSWNPVAYNVLEYKVVGGGVVDDTAALQALVDRAISEGRKAIYFPAGEYYVTALTNADQVVFFGDNASFVGGYTGTIYQMGDWATNEQLAETPSGVVNAVLGYDADPSGLTDSTEAIRAAAAAAMATRSILVLPAGRYLVTDEIEFNEAVYIQGLGMEQGNGGSTTAKAVTIIFTNSEVDGGGNATKCLFRFKKLVAYRLQATRLENIEIVHTSTVPNQHSVIIEEAEMSSSVFENLAFLDVTGYCIKFLGATYSQNVHWTNLTFIRVGGCVGRDTTDASLILTMAVFQNWNLEVVNPISPQPVLYDLSGMRHFVMDSLLCEGSLAGVTGDIVGLKLGCSGGKSTGASLRSVWFEFSGVKQLTNTIETVEGGTYHFEDVMGITEVSPVKLGGSDTHMNFKGLYAFDQRLHLMFNYQSPTASVVVDGAFFRQLQSIPYNKTGIVEMKNGIAIQGTERVRFNQEARGELFMYSGGFLQDNRFITWNKPGSTNVTSVEMETDSDEGRCLLYKNSSNNSLPNFGGTIAIPSNLYGCSVVIGYRYKMVTVDTNLAQALVISSAGANISRTNTSIKNEWTTGYAVVRNVQGNIILSTANTSPASAHELLISDVQILIGNVMPVLIGKTRSTQIIDTVLSAIPTIGDYVRGDRIRYPLPAAAGKVGAVCVTSGTPGTWKEYGVIDA